MSPTRRHSSEGRVAAEEVLLSNTTAKKPDLNWHDLRHVLAVARARAIAPAARVLGVNETTVARRIARAETCLGSKLFDRIDGSMRPTEAGEIAVARAERVEVEIDLLRAAASGADGSAAGTVRLTSIPLIVNRLLVPALRDLHAAHPRLHIEMIAEPRNLSLTRRDADIALRLARPQREQKVLARHVGGFDYAVYGPRRTKVAHLPWITYDESLAALPHVAWIDRAIKREGRAPAVLSVNDSEVALHAIRAGIGKSLLPCVIGDRDAELTRFGGPEPTLRRELWLLVHPELKNLARIRAVIGWLDNVVLKSSKSIARAMRK
jgi:DNA-binding transcriptional LysR family regulator